MFLGWRREGRLGDARRIKDLQAAACGSGSGSDAEAAGGALSTPTAGPQNMHFPKLNSAVNSHTDTRRYIGRLSSGPMRLFSHLDGEYSPPLYEM
jgi:hypothetical protein